MNRGQKRRAKSERGNAIIEASLLLPWILFLFMAVFDFGFYAYSMIATENAARTAALYTSADFSTAMQEAESPNPPTRPGACQYAVGELLELPNVKTPPADCSSLPVQVVVAPPTLQADGSYLSRVTVTYQTMQMFTLPFLPGSMTITRSVDMRVRGD